MKIKKIVVFTIILLISISSIFAGKGIIGLSSSNLDDGCTLDLLNIMLKQKLESNNYKYYYADSNSDESIQYYSVIDMLNKNIGTLIINPVSQKNFSAIIAICEENNINVIDLYSPFESNYDRIATITYDYKKSSKYLAKDIFSVSDKIGRQMDVVLFIELARTDYRELIKHLINELRENDISLVEYFSISNELDVLNYQSIISYKYTEETILIFPNVKSAELFHKYMMLDKGYDNFIKYCLIGIELSEDEMRENRIKGILSIDSDEIVNIIYSTILNGNFNDIELSQKLITLDEL
jgi:hypothetical protein